MVGEQYVLGVALSNAKPGVIIHNGVATLILNKMLTPVLLEQPKKERKRRIQLNSLQNAARCAENN